MTTMITEVYEAFKSCGVSDEKARKAAEVLSSQKDDTAEIKSAIKLNASELIFHRWILGIILGIVATTLWKVFQ